MKKVIIVHGWSGSPKNDWIPWLESELREYQVSAPEMPDADAPVIEKWVAKLAEAVGPAGPDGETFFVGHSMGCQTILRYLERYATRACGGAVFVAGWFDLKNLEDEEVEKLAKPWLETPIDPEKVRKALPKSTLIISKNDPYGALGENERRFGEIGSKIIELDGAGHMTAGDGFDKIPLALSELKRLIDSN